MLHELTTGNVSFRHVHTNKIFKDDKKIAKIAGYTNQSELVLSENLENIAPIVGPTMNPIENAMPTKAIPLPRLFLFETSVITAILREILPLLKPPIIRAITNIPKLFETAQIM